MSRQTRQANAGSSSAIPPIEIGTFVSLGPDQSEFIGSASGVFFANTVFRAFSGLRSHVTSSSESTPDQPESTSEQVRASSSVVADPGSAHNYIAGSESPRDEIITGQHVIEAETIPTGVAALGTPPSADEAKTLIMSYFQNWHPMFPFLHGPTFLNKVNGFYDRFDSSTESARYTESDLCWAVTLQCILNVATSTRNQELNPAHRIHRASALMSVLGPLYCHHDIPTLQALLAAELYLISIMSLRAAATIHGAATRILYHAGFHRCPGRYSQLRDDSREVRKRIFWSSYVLDRYLAQALGHPVAFNNAEIDVCVPGLEELHQPVPVHTIQPTSFTDNGHQNVLAHLPHRHDEEGTENRGTKDDSADELPDHEQTDPYDALTLQTEADQPQKPAEAGKYVLAYYATYSRVLGDALSLFHASIHDRALTHEKVQRVTSRAHAWWNSLPNIFRDHHSQNETSKSPYITWFALLYRHLILIIHRPFLSLPTHRIDFQHSLQIAVTASYEFLTNMSSCDYHSFPSHWPGFQSATWMASLVIAFSCLLHSYPFEKAKVELESAMAILNQMPAEWKSARRCLIALDTLYRKLCVRQEIRGRPASKRPITQSDFGNTGLDESHDNGESDGTRSSKRQRQLDVPMNNITGPTPNSVYPPLPDWMPVLEYTGPDFGFDTTSFDIDEMRDESLSHQASTEFPGFFSNTEWNAYMNTFDGRFNF